jgi:hypothetical protein
VIEEEYNVPDASANADQNTRNDQKLEMVVHQQKKKVRRVCQPNVYLPRNFGVMNQCIRINDFGQFFGDSAKQSVWPSSLSFLQGAFLYCPGLGTQTSCRAMAFDKLRDLTSGKNGAAPEGGYVCARMMSPVPPPWPQFDGFIYNETVQSFGSCRIDQLPMLRDSGGKLLLYCLNLADVLSTYTNNGHCGCGWSLMWSPFDAKFICG